MEVSERKKGNGLLPGLLIAIFIAMIVIIILFVYYLNGNNTDDKKENTTTSNNTNNNNEVVKKDIIEVSLDSLEAAEFAELYDNLQTNNYRCNGDSEFGYLYHKADKMLAEDMPNSVKMDLSYKLLKKDNLDYIQHMRNSNGDYQIPESLLESAYHVLFGNDSKFKFTESESCPFILKESHNNDYYPLKDGNIYIATQCGGTCYSLSGLNQKIIKFEKTVDQKELYIYEEIAYLEPKTDKETNKDYANYYKDPDKKELIGNTKDETYEEISAKKQMSVYKYTFKYQPRKVEKTENYTSYHGLYGNEFADWTSYRDYYFYSVEKVK